MIIGSLKDRLRPLVGSEGWDYCIMWKLNEHERVIEWIDCCCAGAENNSISGEQKLLSPVSSVSPCRDVMFHHQRTKACDLLAPLPSSMPLDSGIHAQTLFSNQPRWLNFSTSLDSSIMEETVGTRVLIPVVGGLIELFIAKQVYEDQDVIDFITTQCSMSIEKKEVMMNSRRNYDGNQYLGDYENEKFLSDKLTIPFQSVAENGIQAHESMTTNTAASGMYVPEMMSLSSGDHKNGNDKDKDSAKQGPVQSESISDCSDQIDNEEDCGKDPRGNEKEPKSKNLMAERKRRKKLNDKLLILRSLVPKISKLDKAAILVDAIDFVKTLQKQVTDLQNELEVQVKDDQDTIKVEGKTSNDLCNCHTEIDHEKGQQMEPQVEVVQLGGNDFLVKVFCEHKPGGFVRLLEALTSLGLEITNVNVTSYRMTLVTNVFRVEKRRDNEMVQADYVRDSLIELTRDSYGGCTEKVKKSDNGSSFDSFHQHCLDDPQSYHRIHHLNS